MNIQLYKNSTDTIGVEVDHLQVLNAIKGGKWKEMIDNLRTLEGEEYSEAKRMLPSCTFAGTFTKRASDSIKDYSGMIILDVDDLDKEQIESYKKSFKDDEYIYACFISPGGYGIKILVKHSCSSVNHLASFTALEKYFKEVYALALDRSGKDISRLCYISVDAELYLNDCASIFVVTEEDIKQSAPVSSRYDERPEKYKGYVVSKDSKYTFGVCEQWTQRLHQYTEGNRNNYIHVLCCNLNRTGVVFDDALLLVYNNYSDLPFKEIEQTVASAYKMKSEHNTIDVYNLYEKEEEELGLTPQEETIFNDTTSLLKSGVQKNIISKLVKVFGVAFLSIKEERIVEVMKMASEKLQGASGGIDFLDINQAIEAYGMSNINQGGISTSIPDFDEALGGRIQKGSFVGLIADGGCYKSIYAQCIGSQALKEDKVVLYLCGEMSLSMMMTRTIEKELGLIGVRDVTPEIHQQLQEKMKNNFFLSVSSDWTKESILKAVASIKVKTGKDVDLIIADGLTQMEDTKKNEIHSAIFNSEQCKRIAKEANDGRECVVIALVHVSGSGGKHYRNTFEWARGGKKILNNMDAYICHSLIIDEQSSNFDTDDIFYRQNMFYIRMVDKRNSGSIVSKIIQVNRPMELVPLEIDPSIMEVSRK